MILITRDWHLISLNDRRLQTMLLLLSKNLFLSRYPNYIEQMFSLIHSVTENGLQDINILTLPKPRTTYHPMGWTHLLVSFSAKLLFSHPDKIQTCTETNTFTVMDKNVSRAYLFIVTRWRSPITCIIRYHGRI